MARDKQGGPEQARQFAAALAVLLLALAALPAWRGHFGRSAILAALAAGPPAAALLVPEAWHALFLRWSKAAHAISWVVTRVVLISFFYLLLTPFCVVLRLFGRARADHGFRDGRATYWVPRSPVPATLERYRKSY